MWACDADEGMLGSKMGIDVVAVDDKRDPSGWVTVTGWHGIEVEARWGGTKWWEHPVSKRADKEFKEWGCPGVVVNVFTSLVTT